MMLQNCRPLWGRNHFLGLLAGSAHPSGTTWRSDSWGFKWFLTAVKGNKLNSRNPLLLGLLRWLQLYKCACVGVCVPACMHASMCASVWCASVRCMSRACVGECRRGCVCVHTCAHMCITPPPHSQRATKCRCGSREATLSSKSTELGVRKPNLECIWSKFFLLPTLLPWTSYEIFPNLSLLLCKMGVTIPASSLWRSKEKTCGRILCKPKHIAKTQEFSLV